MQPQDQPRENDFISFQMLSGACLRVMFLPLGEMIRCCMHQSLEGSELWLRERLLARKLGRECVRGSGMLDWFRALERLWEWCLS
jgi:hypothetical protein